MKPLQLKAMQRRSTISVCTVISVRSVPSTHESLRQVIATETVKVLPKTCLKLFIGIPPLQLKAMRRRSSISVGTRMK
jgi:hypothetical protein